MKNLILFALILNISSILSSQEVLHEREVKLKSFFLSADKNESFPVVNAENGEIGLFLLDKKEIKSLLFDKNYILKDSFITDKPKGSFDVLLGNTFENNNYTLFFSNDKKSKFLAKTINITNKKSSFKELELKLKGEEFIESINYNNKLYIITIKRVTSILNVYEFKGSKISRIEKIDLSEHKFSKASKSLFYVLFHTTSALKEDIILNKIDNRNPNAIDLASYANKIYCYNNTIYITLDVYDDYTKLISIGLTNFDSKVEDYPFEKVDCEYDLGIRSNSYLLENNIYQISGCKNELYFSIADINTKTKLKEWRVGKNDEIDFKNTPFIQLGGAFSKNKKYKELGETEQILKKIEAGNIGISVYKPIDNLEITIGGYRKMVTKELIAAATFGAAFSSMTLSNPSIGPDNNYYYSNPTVYSFQNYSYARSVYFKSLLNKNLEHVKGSLNDNAFDKIKKYVEENHKNISTETLFKVNDYYVLGYYYKKEGIYYLLKFVD